MSDDPDDPEGETAPREDEDRIIHALDDRTVDRIAAGEVVERPASVVKELVENSLDADATRIDVEVTGNGTERIAVADDGRGMSEDDVRTAVEQHTTSKIRDIEDLTAGVATLGFRGEALYTIGAVSRMTVTSRRRGGDAVGTELRVVGGTVESVTKTGRPPGTTITVEDLFFNTPARRKYLKTDATEFAHINRVVTRYALANPEVAITLSHDGNRVFATTGGGDLQEAMLSIYGREVAESMIEVEYADEAVTVEGYVSDPETTRSAREYVSTFVNGRYVRDGDLRAAVLDGYGKQLAADRYPFAALFVEVPPDRVDVNVHPRKMSVRFDEEAAVFETVESAVQNALLDHGMVRTRAPRGRSAPDDAPVSYEPTEVSEHTMSAGPENAVRTDDSLEGASSPGQDGSSPEGTATDREESATSSGADPAPGRSEPSADSDRRRSDTTTDSVQGRPNTEAESGPGRPNAGTESDRGGSNTGAGGSFGAPLQQPGLTDVEPSSDFDTLPPLRVLGQIHETYVVAESPDGLVLIDQHAADERIHYERLAGRLAARSDSQALVSPVEVELTAHEASVFDESLSALREIGFEARRDGGTALVEAVPAVLSESLDPTLVQDVLASFLEGDGRDVVDSAADAIIADLACYPAITGNTSLTEGDVVTLLERLDDCVDPFSCPHGRPVIIELTEGELADRFERDYPGHQTRRPE